MGVDHLFDELKKALAERVLNAEIDDHLGGEAAAGKRNSRNGYSKKTVLTETSKLDLRIPRDRDCQESCVRGRVDHHALTNLSSNMMAN